MLPVIIQTLNKRYLVQHRDTKSYAWRDHEAYRTAEQAEAAAKKLVANRKRVMTARVYDKLSQKVTRVFKAGE